jgi:hypothetical protein
MLETGNCGGILFLSDEEGEEKKRILCATLL